MNMIVEDWVKLKNAEERNIMIRRAQSARIIITFAYCIMGIGCFYLIVLPSFGISMRDTTNITDPGRPMPLQTHYIYDVTKSPQYELTFISQSVYIIIAMMSYSGIDNFLGLLVFHICGQLDILKNRLTNLDKCKNSHKILNSCITRHIRLLRGSKPVYLTAGKVFPVTMATFCSPNSFDVATNSNSSSENMPLEVEGDDFDCLSFDMSSKGAVGYFAERTCAGIMDSTLA
ncbi:PREDICTED: uncharacterized protein LOC105144618 [Acromyrmex echinatior]|uniref:uncharacterized protein LOC105144618 n=1 Tax=Acromyrmex echinatior TaxID=103372 RepID=UPI000580E275|nr:PREDICTED: uncharacterized protein LOC105144618 [Acromyrmex echinatior]